MRSTRLLAADRNLRVPAHTSPRHSLDRGDTDVPLQVLQDAYSTWPLRGLVTAGSHIPPVASAHPRQAYDPQAKPAAVVEMGCSHQVSTAQAYTLPCVPSHCHSITQSTGATPVTSYQHALCVHNLKAQGSE